MKEMLKQREYKIGVSILKIWIAILPIIKDCIR